MYKQKRESRPVRARGLKHEQELDFSLRAIVAPRAGAWIETIWRYADPDSFYVAPRAGAWIETAALRALTTRYMSRPVRARGLKR